MKSNNIIKSLFFLATLLFFYSCTNKVDHPLISGELTQVEGEYKFTEGPASDKNGNIYFTDIPDNRIYVYTVEGEVKLHNENSGGANGLYIDRHNNLFACQGGNRQVVFYNVRGQIQVLSEQYRRKRYNRPNDLWVDPQGGVYFTDPAYGIDSSMLEMDGQHVYFIHPNRREVIRVCDDLVKPNGIIGTPDGKKIYITDHKGGMTWQYSVRGDGILAGKREFVNMGCDGLTVDSQLNVYLTNLEGSSIDVYSPDAELLVSIPVPEKPTNITFGGKNNSTLFITARTTAYFIEMAVQGSP